MKLIWPVGHHNEELSIPREWLEQDLLSYIQLVSRYALKSGTLGNSSLWKPPVGSNIPWILDVSHLHVKVAEISSTNEIAEMGDLDYFWKRITLTYSIKDSFK